MHDHGAPSEVYRPLPRCRDRNTRFGLLYQATAALLEPLDPLLKLRDLLLEAFFLDHHALSQINNFYVLALALIHPFCLLLLRLQQLLQEELFLGHYLLVFTRHFLNDRLLGVHLLLLKLSQQLKFLDALGEGFHEGDLSAHLNHLRLALLLLKKFEILIGQFFRQGDHLARKQRVLSLFSSQPSRQLGRASIQIYLFTRALSANVQLVLFGAERLHHL